MLRFIHSNSVHTAMRNLIAAFVSLILTTIVIGNAFYQKKQFYPSIVYLTKSNPSMAVIYVQSFTLVVFAGKIMRIVFFGELRAAEFEHLMERSWYAVTETCLAFTVFRDDFSPKFVALFTLLLFLKSFHWLAEDRVDFMERSPVISLLFHVRVLSLLFLLALLDITFVTHAYQSTLDNGASVQLVFGFEYAILLTIIINIGLKYVLHSVDLHSQTPWENKAVFLLYTELIMGFIKMILYLVFVFIMVRVYTLPLFAFRPMYYTMRAFKKALNDVILSRRAIRNMNTLYPDATPEELAAADNVCIICREDMRSASKKLPCNHIFHTACLRSWFQRQQTCPTCRLNILRNPVNNNSGRPQEQQQQQQDPPPTPPPPNPAPQNQQVPPQDTVQFPWIHPFNLPQNQQPGSSNENVTPPSNSMGINPEFIPEFTPLFPFMTLNAPPPLPPFTSLTDEQLSILEKHSRDGVEMRIKCLQNISKMLDASVIMMHQYASAAKAAAESCPHVDTTRFNSSTSQENDSQDIGGTSQFATLPDPSNCQEASSSGTSSSDVQEETRKRRLEKFLLENKSS